MKELVLQERVTLDGALLDNVRTYRNGCNWRLVKELDNNYYLEYGCDGVYINLIQGSAKMLYKWFITPNEMQMKNLTKVVQPETILELLKKEPCRVCGGTRFRFSSK
jgi:hypothetical protein